MGIQTNKYIFMYGWLWIQHPGTLKYSNKRMWKDFGNRDIIVTVIILYIDSRIYIEPELSFCIIRTHPCACSFLSTLSVSVTFSLLCTQKTHILLIPIRQCLYATQFKSIVSVFEPFLGGIPFKLCIEKQIGILYAFDSLILQSHRFCILEMFDSLDRIHVIPMPFFASFKPALYPFLATFPFRSPQFGIPTLSNGTLFRLVQFTPLNPTNLWSTNTKLIRFVPFSVFSW